MSFEELQLAPPILKALAQCGHHTPTPVQEQSIPEVLAGHDLIASAQTGTGKTAAFVLPALQRLSADSSAREPGLRVLVVTPTRELASQITEVARTYGKHIDIHSVAIFGGMPQGDQIRALAQLPDMIIGTPGRLIDHIWHGRINLSHVEMLVLDEADRMLEMGFIDDVEFISDAMPEECQRLLFAATMGSATTKLAEKFMNNPHRVDVAPDRITADNVEQRLHMADNLRHKNRMLQHFCSDTTVTRAIIFSATKRDADSLARSLHAAGHAAAALHADMTQAARNHTIMNMKKGKIRLLVATDVAARGLDINGISHVINFDLPRSPEDYVNRIGRTARAGESGIAISFAARGDLPYLDRIERYLGYKLTVQAISGLEPEQDISGQGGHDRSDQKTRSSRDRRTKSLSESEPRRHEGSRSGGRETGRRPSRSSTTEKHAPTEQGNADTDQIVRGRRPNVAGKRAHAGARTEGPVNLFGISRYQSRPDAPKEVRDAT
jgi:superfamily II DNA/RNA helicase